MHRGTWLFVVGCLASCDALPGKSQPVTPVMEAPKGAPSPVPADVAAPAKTAAKIKPTIAPIDPAKQAAFKAAVKQARKHMADKQYAAAIAAYDTALAAVPDYPRGLSGRGYAKLLAGDLPGADVDLQRALIKAPEAKLRSAVAFNLGLLAEKQNDAAAAQKWYLEAHRLRPGKATAAKIGGASKELECGVQRHDDPGKSYPNWLALWRGVAADIQAEGYKQQWGAQFIPPEPADEAAARAFFLDEADSKTGPWLTHWRLWDPEEKDWHYCPFSALLIAPDGPGLRLQRAHWYTTKEWDDQGCVAHFSYEDSLLPGPVLATRVDLEIIAPSLGDACEDEEEDEDCVDSATETFIKQTTVVYAGTPPRQVLSIDTSEDDYKKLELSPGLVKVRHDDCVLDLPIPQ